MKSVTLILALLLCAVFGHAQTITLTLEQQPCNGDGVVKATLTGFTAPATVTWYDNGGILLTDVINGNESTLMNYSGEILYVYALDGVKHSAWSQGFSAPPFGVDPVITTAVCPALGSIALTITGGVSPYTYEWARVGSSGIIGTTNPISLPTGNYSVTVTDANGCRVALSENQDSFGLVINNDPGFTYELNSTEANCTDGTASVVNLAGGTTPFTYEWSNGSNSQSIQNLISGSYNVTVTDGNGCSLASGVEIRQSVYIPVNATVTPATCEENDGAIIAFGSGGQSPYSYQWNTGATTQSIDHLSSGYYYVTAVDANGCRGIGFGNVWTNSPVYVAYQTTPSNCTTPTGSATLSISGGQSPYTVVWSTFPAQSGVTATNLISGTYTFKVTDVNGCVRTGTVYVPPVNVISANISEVLPTCIQANGSLLASPTGGTAPYTYVWSTGANTPGLNNLTSGYYSILITDSEGCTLDKARYLYSTSPVMVGLSVTPASCKFTADGSITANAWGGTAPYTYQWSNGSTSAINSNISTGRYEVWVTDANGCVNNEGAVTHLGYDETNNSCYCTIMGTVYHDLNNNCVQDANEPGIPNIQLHCDNGVGYTYTDQNGVYSFEVLTGTYTISETVKAFYPLSGCQNNKVVVNVTVSNNCIHTVDFANTTNPIHDIHISTWDINYPVPGFGYRQKCVITNEGTVDESAMLAGYQTDNQVGAPQFSPNGVFTTNPTTGHSSSSSFPSLAPGQHQVYNIDYLVPTNIPLGTSLTFTDSITHMAPMSNWLTDYSPWNNVNNFRSTTVGAYDPNFVAVLPQGEGQEGFIYEPDSILEYMVHFQNLGTYYARNVTVLSTLDENLDWPTLKPVYSSHPCKVTMDENGHLKYQFEDIYLPAKSSFANDEASSGFFTYTIRVKPNSPIGTKFRNNADIYFDFNAPIATNTTLNTLGKLVNVEEGHVVSNTFNIYPNPAGNIFYAKVNSELEERADISVTDITGRTVITKTVELKKGEQAFSIDAKQLTSGIYFVRINNGQQFSSAKKLVVIK